VRDLTPRQIVAELDRDIVGQADAKRAVALALRNRWRRRSFGESCGPGHAQEHPLIGRRGWARTEIARRLAQLVCCPRS
jgi:ATP-dependent HslUV protease ATP-binding subunit HslU